MPSKVTLIAVLAILGFSTVALAVIGVFAFSPGAPVEESVPRNTKGDDSVVPEAAANSDKSPYNQDFHAPSYTLDKSDALENQGLKLLYNPQDFYAPPLILDGSYSEDSGRIVGGTEAAEGAAPYMVALIVGDVIRSFLCGGTILNRNIVLSAAHCIDPMLSWWDGQLLPSAHGQIGSNSLTKGYTVVRFVNYLNHPSWDPWTIKNDIGLLWLMEPLNWSKIVLPLKSSFEWMSGGQSAGVYGWGRISEWGMVPDRLQGLDVVVLTPKECEEGIREAIGHVGTTEPLVRSSPVVEPDIEVCTRHENGQGYGMCYGDSGSALVRKDRKQQIGIVSWGFPCARGAPDMFVRLSAYRNWIVSAIKGVPYGN